jgi:hypothetical protein
MPKVNRAFSAGPFWVLRILGRRPRLEMNAAPFALLPYRFFFAQAATRSSAFSMFSIELATLKRK